MRAELEQKLQDDFPFMNRDNIKDERNLYKNWGCECDDGWYQLLHDLCQEITDRYAKDGLMVDIEVHQIKEKYAGLRFYYGFKKEKEDEAKAKLRKDIEDIVLSYENKSETVCEECGKEGTVRDDLSWILTLCDDCYGERMKKMTKRS